MPKTVQRTAFRYEELSRNTQDNLRFHDEDFHDTIRYDVSERLCEIVSQVTGMRATPPRSRSEGPVVVEWSLSNCQGDGVAFYGGVNSVAMLESLDREDNSGYWVEDLTVISPDLELVRAHLRKLIYHRVDIELARTSISNHYSHYNSFDVEPEHNGCEHEDEGECTFYPSTDDPQGWEALEEFFRRLSRYCEREGYEYIEDMESPDNLKYHYAGTWFDEDGKVLEVDDEDGREEHLEAMEHADTLARVEKQKAEHPDDCLFCQAGEPLIHNYEPPQEA